MQKKIYTVATAHLDTIWSWDFETTVSRYIYNTLVDNFALFKKYPTYHFNFEGSYRYAGIYCRGSVECLRLCL